MTTTDSKAPYLELRYPHEDGDVVITLTATFRGDVRKILGEVGKDVEKSDAELGVAGQIFRVVQDAAEAASNQAQGERNENEDGDSPSKD